MLKVIARHPEFATHQYKNPTRKVAAVYFDNFLARADSFRAMSEGFVIQLDHLLDTRNSGGRPCLNATSGAPGCGKTRFLDELVSPESYRQYLPEKYQKLFSADNVLTLNITFNSRMPRQSSESSYRDMMTSRLLFRFVMRRNLLNYT